MTKSFLLYHPITPDEYTVKTKELSIDKRVCACGCGSEVSGYNSWKREVVKFVHGHNMRGHKYIKLKTRGILNSSWKGGRNLTPSGYIELSSKHDHPKNHQGRILEHRFIYEQYHKCCILRHGAVHHINGDKTDNRIENLKGMTSSQHTRLHFKKKDSSI